MITFTDGEWHRLHPATPLLRGGISLIAIIGVVIAQLREQLIGMLVGAPEEDGDPWVWLTHSDLFWLIALAILAGLILFVGGFYLSWRMHTFRITAEVVEVRSGILFRTNRKARLDRIQGINIVRPFFARLFGAAKLEIDVAGQNANVQLSYLGSSSADHLRAEVLRLASGTREAGAPPRASSGDVIRDRVDELLAPELDPQLAPPQSVVSMHLGRVIGSLLLSNVTLSVALFIAGCVVTAFVASPYALAGILPGAFGVASYYTSRFSKSLRFTIASTPDGIRIGYGLLSTTNETLPPGRIHAVQLSQPLLWRIAGWWEIKVNRASTSSTRGAAGQANTTILPVGNRADAMRVLALVLPNLDSDEARALLASGLSRGGEFQNSPRRGAVLRWFSWWRNGFAFSDDVVLFRTGVVWRRLVIVPLARVQSVSHELSFLRRRLRLATVRLHTVTGPVSPVIGAVDAAAALMLFDRVAAAAVSYGNSDTSHRWRERA